MDPMSVASVFVPFFEAGTFFRHGVARAKQYYSFYGPIGIFLPFVISPEIWDASHHAIHNSGDEEVMIFRQSLVDQANMTAITGSIMAQVAITAIALEYMSQVHWTSQAFILTSLLTGCTSVYTAVRQLRILGPLTSPRRLIDWLRAPDVFYKVQNVDDGRPNLARLLILNAPYTMVDLSVVTFLIGLCIYIIASYIQNVNPDESRQVSLNVMIWFVVSASLCLWLYSKAFHFSRGIELLSQTYIRAQPRRVHTGDSVENPVTIQIQSPGMKEGRTLEEMLRAAAKARQESARLDALVADAFTAFLARSDGSAK